MVQLEVLVCHEVQEILGRRGWSAIAATHRDATRASTPFAACVDGQRHRCQVDHAVLVRVFLDLNLSSAYRNRNDALPIARICVVGSTGKLPFGISLVFAAMS
jgi:hypothetical protein